MATEKTITPIYQKLPEKGVLRVAAYCRVSISQNEQLHSLAAQISHYTEILSGDSTHKFVGIYADRGISGTQVKNRAEFLRLMEDCRAGLVDQIITKSVSRFGRNTVDTLLYTRELRSLGIDVYFEKERLHSCSAEGELMLTLMAALAESESENMSENIKWGKRRRYEKGCVESLALANLYGYRKAGGKLAVDEAEAAVIRRIYSEFLDGLNYEQISQRLNADGIPTRRGNDVWFNRTVMNVLTNEKYMGDCLFQKTFHIDPISHKKVPNKGQLPQYYLEDCVPAIVSKEVWNLAQLEIQRRQTWKPMSSAELPFKNRIVCGSCGSGVVRYYAKHKGGVLDTMWRCGSWRKGKAKGEGLPLCAQIKIPLDAPEKAFVRAWNLVVSKKLQYGAALRRRAEIAEDVLIRYRTKEMLRFLDEVGKLETFDYYFSLKVLDHMELMPDGKLAVVFLSGVRLTL
jgi:site-specific DNA recombinase